MMRTEKTPKVSVCVVTYNQGKYIRQCLQSIVEQRTDFDYEIIVSDDGSTDDTCAIVQEFAIKYPEMVKPIFHEKNIGPFKNFVTTHNMAIGEFIAHCDGDDLFFPEKLQKQINYFEKHKGCTVVWHRVNFFNELDGFSPGEAYDYSMFNNGVVTIEKALRFGSIAAHSSIMYRRSARKTKSPDFDTLDLFYSWEYLLSGWGKILDDVVGAYRVNAVGAFSKKFKLIMRARAADHAKYYLKLLPAYRKSIFLFAFTNFLIDIKNRRKTALIFFTLMMRAFSCVSPKELFFHFNAVRKLKPPKL